LDVGVKMKNVVFMRTPLPEITSTGEIEQSFRSN
jgi:hypothetical protein